MTSDSSSEPQVEPQVKGTKIKSKLVFVEEAFGDSAVRRVLDRVSEEDRKVLKSVLDVGWYPLGVYDRLLEAIVAGAGGGDPRILDRMGREAADYQAEHAYGAYFRKRDPRSLLEAMIPMHAQINKPGKMELVDGGERRVSLVVSEPPATALSCRIARAFYQRALQIVDGTSARILESACQARGDAHCRFEITW